MLRKLSKLTFVALELRQRISGFTVGRGRKSVLIPGLKVSKVWGNVVSIS